MTRDARCLSVVAMLACVACGVDTRLLDATESPAADASGGAPSGKVTVLGGQGGNAESQPASADGCADLDTDGTPDCDTTLVEDPTFAADVSGWTALGDATLRWAHKDSLGDGASGSALLHDAAPADAVPRASAFQCVPLAGSALVVAYASAFVVALADDEDQAQAELQVTFFDGPDCSGESGGFFETPPSTVAGGWTTVQAGGISPDTTSSLGIALVGIKAPSSAELDVYFDDILLKARSL